MLRLDPRGDQVTCHCGSPFRRAAQAMARTFVTRDSRGRQVPNVPLGAGAYAGAAIATAWYPASYRPGHEGIRVAAFTVLGKAASNVAREFAPELKRLIPGRERGTSPSP